MDVASYRMLRSDVDKGGESSMRQAHSILGELRRDVIMAECGVYRSR